MSINFRFLSSPRSHRLNPMNDMEEFIEKYCTDITKKAAENAYDPITGRDVEIEQTALILLQRGRRNVMLQGPAGVGKTALCVGLAQQIVAGNVPDRLKKSRVIELDLASMAAGTTTMSEFHGRLIPFLKGMGGQPVILFIDEIHQIMPTCENSSYKGLSEVLKPYLTGGTLSIVGATTADEYRQYIGVDPAMDRRFQTITLEVPNDEQTAHILKIIKKGYEKHHGLEITDEICDLIVNLTATHMRKRAQPDKSISVMDAACAREIMDDGSTGQLTARAVKRIVADYTGLHPDAL